MLGLCLPHGLGADAGLPETRAVCYFTEVLWRDDELCHASYSEVTG